MLGAFVYHPMSGPAAPISSLTDARRGTAPSKASVILNPAATARINAAITMATAKVLIDLATIERP